MESQLKYNAIDRKRSINELLHNCELWTADLKFIKIEISFLKMLLVTFPFKSTIPNLFEKLQLFSKDLENLESIRTTIYKSIESHNQELNKKIETTKLIYNTCYLTTHFELTEEVLDYYETYKNLKMKIYEFITGLIKNKS